MKRIALLLALAISFSSFSQLAPTRKLWGGLNRTNTKNARPVLSGDGKYMIYLTDLDQSDSDMKMWYTKKGGGESWDMQELVDVNVNRPTTNIEGAFFISYDGKSMLLTARRSGGVGKYDIWESKRSGDIWKDPSNFGKPLNSESNDGFPSLSPDGKMIYFSRCATMTSTNCSGCKIMMAERGRVLTKTPVALPSYINTGNSMAPLILADNKTLIYSSNKQGGKGGYDLFLTRFENGKWAKPMALNYVNTSADEKFLSIPARGDVAYFSKVIEGKSLLVKAKIPKKYRQRNILWLQGKVAAPDLKNIKIQVLNLTTGEKITSVPNKNGEFLLLPTAGAKYDISVRDTDGKFTFASRLDDLTNSKSTKREKWNVVLKMLPGSTLDLGGVSFKPYSATLTKESENDLNRLIFLMKKNPTMKVTIGVHIPKVKKDSVRSEKDLTEEIVKLIYVNREVEVIDSVMQYNVMRVDSVMKGGLMSVDSLMQDSVKVAVVSIKIVKDEVKKYTYHNDRTPKQAEVILSYLKSKGIPISKIAVKGYGDRQKKLSEADKRKVLVEVKF